MKISFVVNDVAFIDYKNLEAVWGWTPYDKRLGGTEESVVRWGEQLASRGHKVRIYQNGFNGTYKGCVYHSRRDYKGGGDICINVKSSHIKPKEPTLYLTNETDISDADLSEYLGVIWPSKWAEDNIPVNNRTFILPHGYDEDEIYPGKKVPKQCLYSSSPDRGLNTLEQIWPSIVDNHPDAQLYVSYGANIGTPNTTCGEFSEDEMNELYRTSDIWLHPCSGGELYGISGIKAQAAGAIPVYFPTMALAETIQEGVKCTDPRDMYEKLNVLLGDEAEKARIRGRLYKIHFTNWKDSTDKLLDIISMVS